jgi:hypothetical protein
MAHKKGVGSSRNGEAMIPFTQKSVELSPSNKRARQKSG